MPAASPAPGDGSTPAGKLPPMPGFPNLKVSTNMQNTTKMPNVSMEQFKMSKFYEEQMEHHKRHHLLPNGDCKPHLKEEGWKYFKKFRG